MPFPVHSNRFTPQLFGLFAMVLALVIIFGVARDYSFMPNRGVDGFLYQIEHARSIVASGDWQAVLSTPLSLIHILRFGLVWPFLQAEQVFGPAGSLALLELLLWPLLFIFQPQRGNWRDVAGTGVRLAVLFLPLFVSGRTVLVAAGMGYLVSGIMMRPFSAPRLWVGGALAVLSSASILFSIAVLVVAGNWKDRSRAFYAAKVFFLILVIGLFVPSLFAKADGFANGATGYAYEEVMPGSDTAALYDDLGSGPVAAVTRIVMRSTVVQSYREGNVARLVLYIALFAAAWGYILWSAAVRHWHPMLVVLVVLSGGILLEGLSVWPILFPLVWAYTGIVRTERNRRPVDLS